MRFNDRFAVNDVQHPTDVLKDIRSGVLQKIKHMMIHLNQKNPQNIFNTTVALITQSVYQRDHLQQMIDNR